MTDKTVLITGASSGMGLQIAKELAKRGKCYLFTFCFQIIFNKYIFLEAKIILTCRDLKKGKEAVKCIRQVVPKAIIDLRQLDVSCLHNVRDFCKYILNYYTKIDVLINNAGIMFYPYEITDEGFEIHFVTNYLGNVNIPNVLVKYILNVFLWF